MTTRDLDATATDRRRRWAPRRIALLAGPAATIVLIGGILLAAYVFSPASNFQWTGDLDQFGILRHYSIALGGLLGLVFLWPVWTDAGSHLQRAGIGIFAIGLGITVSANALAAAEIRAGDWAILGLVLLFPVALLVHGLGDVSAGYRRRGGISFLLGVLYSANIWLLFPASPAPQGYELVFYVGSFVLVSAWIVVMAVSLWE